MPRLVADHHAGLQLVRAPPFGPDVEGGHVLAGAAADLGDGIAGPVGRPGHEVDLRDAEHVVELAEQLHQEGVQAREVVPPVAALAELHVERRPRGEVLGLGVGRVLDRRDPRADARHVDPEAIVLHPGGHVAVLAGAALRVRGRQLVLVLAVEPFQVGRLLDVVVKSPEKRHGLDPLQLVGREGRVLGGQGHVEVGQRDHVARGAET